MCTGRVDLSFLVRAFLGGADGVIIGGCWPGECHYVTGGNYDALGNTLLCRRLLEHVGIEPTRLRIEWIGASEGNRFAEVMSDFAAQLRQLGPLGGAVGPGGQIGPGSADGAGGTATLNGRDRMQRKLQAVSRLIPFLKLVEREKLRLPAKDEQAYRDFYASDGFARLFDELIVEKLTATEILLALEERPLATAEIAAALGLTASVVSRHMNLSSQQGLVRYDSDRQSYALAR